MEIEELEKIPDVSFTDNATLEDIENLLISKYIEKLSELTKKEVTLEKADKYRVILLSNAVLMYQMLQMIEKAGKMNLLKYTFGDYLDNVAIFKNIVREKEDYAVVSVQFSIAEVREAATSIPKGTRVSAGNIYFESLEYNEILPGNMNIIIDMKCTVPGTVGNDLVPGEINVLTDPVPYISEVNNINTSHGGADIESDDNMKERTMLSSAQYNTTGTEEAYKYWCRKCNTDIKDINIESSVAGVVEIYFVKSNGILPSDEEIQEMTTYLSDKSRKTLTDKISVYAPEEVPYNIDVTYYINREDLDKVTTIQNSVEDAVEAFSVWQSEKIGRDISTDDLITCIKNAGAKRIVVNEPVYTVINATQLAKIASKKVIYGGLEDD